MPVTMMGFRVRVVVVGDVGGEVVARSRAVVCGLAGVIGRVLAAAGCVLAVDVGATTADAGGWFANQPTVYDV